MPRQPLAVLVPRALSAAFRSRRRTPAVLPCTRVALARGMARRRFFVDQVRNGRAQIEGEDAHHLTRVLRVERGQKYELSDNRNVYLAEVENRNAAGGGCCGATVGFDAAANADAHRRVGMFFARHLGGRL